jgi:uncharacterized protein
MMLMTSLAALSLAGTSAQLQTQDVMLRVPGAELHATLSLPIGVDRPPVVLILAGSGPTDRDGNSPAGVKTDVYRKLSAALGAADIATLRPDKRGVGMSTMADKREDALSFGDYVNDAAAWVKWLGMRQSGTGQSDAGQSDAGQSGAGQSSTGQLGKIGIIGHSEGALVGLSAALKTPVSAYVSLASAGENIADTLTRQLHSNPNNPPALVAEADKIIGSLRTGQRVAQPSPALQSLFRPSVQPYLISWMRLSPAALIATLKVPTLIVQGDRDLQVGVQDAQLLAEAQPQAKLSVVAGMNHVLVDAPTDPAGNLATYTQPALPLSPKLLPPLLDFLSQNLK